MAIVTVHRAHSEDKGFGTSLLSKFQILYFTNSMLSSQSIVNKSRLLKSPMLYQQYMILLLDTVQPKLTRTKVVMHSMVLEALMKI